jgi:hypothetical protein
MSNNYLKRYEAGDYGIWNEIVNLAPSIISNAEALTEATNVATAIMNRVNRNYITLRKTLSKAGMKLAPEGKPLTDADLSTFTARFGPLPLSLDIFYKMIGSISLTPVDYDYGPNALESKDRIDLLSLDPLVVYPANSLDWALDEYDANFTEEEEADNPFGLFLSPDYLHKANVSGGVPYTVYIPASTPQNKLDPIVNYDDEAMPFVDYLRYCFNWGGFPGLAVVDELDDDEIDLNRMMGFESVKGDWRAVARRLLEHLRSGLIPF